MRNTKKQGFLILLLAVFLLCMGVGAWASVDYEYLLTAPDTLTTDPPTTPALVAVTASSTYSGYSAANLCNNAGMTGTQYPQDRHNATSGDMWMTAQNPTSPTLTIDLGDVYPLGKMLIWNYNLTSYTNRGVRNCYIKYSLDGTSWTTWGGGLKELAKATVNPTPATNLTGGTPVDFLGAPARYVKFEITTNWGDTGKYYGLSAIRIYRYASNVTNSAKFVAAKALEWSSAVPKAENTVNNVGMSDAGSGNYGSGATVGTTTQWHTTANNPQPYILYDLGGTYPLDKMYVWNYNVWYGASLSGRGIKNASIYYSVGNPGYPENVWWPWRCTKLVGPNADQTWTFAQASGAAGQAATSNFSFGNALARYVLIIPNAGLGNGNWGGAPGDGTNVYYGLSQVRFFAGAGVVAEPAPYWNGITGQRALTGTAWGGADGGFSIPYPGPGGAQRSLFTFSDTWICNWNPRTYKHGSLSMDYNTFCIWSGGATVTPAIANAAFDVSHEIIPSAPTGAGYWLNGSGIYLSGQSTIYIPANRCIREPYTHYGDSMIALPVSSGNIQWASQVHHDNMSTYTDYQNGNVSITFGGAALLQNGSYVYAYGKKRTSEGMGGEALIVARFTPANIVNFSQWQFRSGSSWVSGVSNATTITATVGQQYTVTMAYDTAHSGQFMATHSNLGAVAIAYSTTPEGPFSAWQEVYAPPENNPDWYNQQPAPPENGAWWYFGTHHPELSNTNEGIFSYCLNGLGDDFWNNAEIYSLRFFRLRSIQ